MIKKITIYLLVMLMFMTSSFALNVDFVSSDPAPIVAGDYADITVRIETNTDEELRDVTFGFVDTNLIKQITRTSTTLSRIQSGEEVTRTFQVFFSEDLEQGNIDVPFRVTTGERVYNFDLDIYVEGVSRKPELYIGDIESIPVDLIKDTENNELVITVQNLGDRDAELVSAELIIDNELITASNSYSLRDSVSSIDAGSEVDFEFEIDIGEEIDAKEVDAILKLNYRYERAVGSTYEITSDELEVPIRIANTPFLVVSNVEQVDDFYTSSTENKVLVTIINEGEEDAEDVRIRLVPDISSPFVFEDLTEYVTARIEVGESATVEFKVEVLEEAQEKEYSITAILEGLVEDTRYSREDIVKISPKVRVNADNNQVANIIVTLIVIIAIMFGIFSVRNRKKSKK